MTNWGSADFTELIEFKKRLEQIDEEAINQFCEDVSKELAARFLRLVIPKTPVGIYPAGSGKVGGTLKRGWTASKSVKTFVDSLSIRIEGNNYIIEIINPIDYASYVEFGHRKENGKGWVPGRFMMTKAELIAKKRFPKLVEKKVEEFIKRQLNG